jgi:exosome complex component RRP4
MSFVLPGDLITDDQGYLRGHGCYLKDGEDGSELISALAGTVERVSKLVIVKSVKSRYIGEVGDLVIGRISSVEARRWKVDINSQKDANLLLSSINLPGGIQRMRTHDDEMQMRTLFTESDLVSAEIQLISVDGSISLHARSLRYGKLENGQYLRVPAGLIKRLPQHYVTLPWGVDIILGRNGGIWITSELIKFLYTYI